MKSLIGFLGTFGDLLLAVFGLVRSLFWVILGSGRCLGQLGGRLSFRLRILRGTKTLIPDGVWRKTAWTLGFSGGGLWQTC